MTTDTSTEPTTPPTPIEAVQDHIVGSFTSLCGDPDNATVAADVDNALHCLDGLLAAKSLIAMDRRPVPD